MNGIRKRFFWVTAFLVAVIMANAQDMQDFVVKVGDFTQLTVVDNINVEYHCNPDSSGYAKFTAEPAMANQIIFSNNKKGKLSITVGTDSVYVDTLPKIVVYSAYLQSAENQGDSTLYVYDVAPAPQVKFKLVDNGAIVIENVNATAVELEIFTGNGTIIADGKCNELKIKNTGTGVIKAEGLLAENVNCRIFGTGKVYCHVNEGKLSLKGSGAGKLYYRGSPSNLKVLQLGTIKAISLDENKE